MLIMDDYEIQNWLKVKAHMEKIGNTDNWYYKRSCAIAEGKPDNFKLPSLNPDEQEESSS